MPRGAIRREDIQTRVDVIQLKTKIHPKLEISYHETFTGVGQRRGVESGTGIALLVDLTHAIQGLTQEVDILQLAVVLLSNQQD